MTLFPTLSLKNTIATLALLIAIFMMSGCGAEKALNSIADDAKGALDGILDGLSPNDPCRNGDAVFTNPSCLGEVPNEQTYNELREARCTISNDIAALCALTIERVCTANLDHTLCSAQVYVDLRTERDAALETARLNVVINDWTDGTDDDGVVGGLNADPNRRHTGNQFLTGLVLNTTWRTFDEVQGSEVLTPEIKATVFAVNNFSDSGDLTLGFEQSEIDTTTNTRPAFNVFKGIDANGDETDTGDTRDGVVFVSGLYIQQSGCEGDLCLINRHYAGLLSTTDLGEPLVESETAATWQGWIQTRGDVSYNQRFDLTITFNDDTNGGTIEAYIENAEATTTALKIDGVFDDQGFVTGDILHGTASNNRIGSGRSPGQLRGLIGDEGAVVAFLSDATGRKGGTNDDPRDQYSGGFVAYLVNPIPATGTKTQAPPPDPCIAGNTCVDYAHWVAAASPTATPTPNQFLQGTSGGLMGAGQGELAVYTTLISNATRYNLEDGVRGAAYAIYRPDRDTDVHNAGILSTTRLGAPLSEVITNAQWPGTFQERSKTDSVTSQNITLNVGFTAGGVGAITGRSQTFASYDIVGAFDRTGVISGTITRRQGADTSIGVISGLIGVDGTVSVFHSNTGASTSFVGGFLASPPAPAPTVTAVDNCIADNTCVDYTHWADADAANPADAPTANRFLKGRPNGLLGSTTTSRLTTKNNTGNYGLDGGDRKDGFATSTSDSGIHSVGLFSTTNLGAPLSKQTPRALWAGTLEHRVGDNSIGSFGITLAVTFDTGTKAGTITSGNVGTEYEIDADFDGTGVISGDITRRAGGDTSAGVISGLIGMEGAVGVFHSNAGATTSYVGGFVASPPPPQG